MKQRERSGTEEKVAVAAAEEARAAARAVARVARVAIARQVNRPVQPQIGPR